MLRCDWLDATELAGLTEEIDRRRGAGHMMGAAAAARVALALIRGDGPAPLPGEWAQLKRADLERLIRRARQVAATARWRRLPRCCRATWSSAGGWT